MATANCDPPPPSYESLFGVDKDLHVKDFVPAKGSEDLGQLVERANAWLQRNPSYRAFTCEMRNIKYGSEGLQPLKSSYTEFSCFSSDCSYMRCLRLWVVKKTLNMTTPQQLILVTKVPAGNDPYENFTDLLARVNRELSQSPKKGKILNVQTVSFKISSGNSLHLQRLQWTRQRKKMRYVNIIYLFFEVGEPVAEELGFADFAPSRISHGDIFSSGDFEPLEVLIERANKWAASQKSIKVTNVLTLDYKLKKSFGDEWLDTTRSAFTEDLSEDCKTYYVRILRVMYTRSLKGEEYPSQAIYCQAFEPDYVDASGYYLTQDHVVNKINDWLRKKDVQILSAETLPVEEQKRSGATYRKVTEHKKKSRYVLMLFIRKFVE